MKRKILVGLSITFVVFLILFFDNYRGKSQNSDIYTQLQVLPDFDRKSVEGNYFLLHFWAKWCAPCAEEIPHMVSFAKSANENLTGLKVLAISLDESLEVSKSILPNQGVGLPVNFLLLLDAKHTLAEALGSFQYPETYFYNTKGQVIEKWVGPQKWDSPEVMEYFKQKILIKP